MSRIPSVDPTRPPSAFKRAMVAVAVSKPGTWFYVNVASRIDPWLIRLSRGRVDTSFGVVPMLLLTVRGRRSGVERTVPLLYFTDGDDVVLMASSFGRRKHPAWYFNVRAADAVRLYRRGVEATYVPREVEGAERDRLYGLAQRLYRGYGLYAERTEGVRTVPVLRLSPA